MLLVQMHHTFKDQLVPFVVKILWFYCLADIR